MIKQLEIAGVHMQVGDDLRKYVTKKIGRLDRYIPKDCRESVHVEIKLKEGKATGKKECTCELIMHLPHETLTIAETTVNIFAAVDIAETKLRYQLKRYKELHANPRLHQRVLSHFKRRPVPEV
jgi:ribosomal subunit interface protein